MSGEAGVREAEERDAPAVRQLCERLDARDYLLGAWGAWMQTPGDIQLVAEHGGRLAGCVRAGLPSPSEAFVQGLRVDPEVRRRGIGRQLLLDLEARLRRRGVTVQRAVTAQGNERARGLAAALRWREVHAVARRRTRKALAAPAAASDASSAAAWPRPPLDVVEAVLRRHPVLASHTGLAHFRRVYFAAAAPWVADAVRAGLVLGADGACAFLDPPARSGLWLHAPAGPAASVVRLIATVAGAGAPGRGALAVEAPDDAELQSGLDALGFVPADQDDRYVVLEATIGPGAVE
jgi:N-acetylglutamate synthase-like GNAT family acetyltransferase